ncbi:MAG: EF-hand domain-containing protein [Gammaproteobacteria bacterium]
MTNKLIGTITVAALALCAAANAAGKPEVEKAKANADTFAALDRNGDKQISRTEAGVDRELSDNFAYIDTDGDGFISLAEFLAHFERLRDPT